jgi:hypothetical protein
MSTRRNRNPVLVTQNLAHQYVQHMGDVPHLSQAASTGPQKTRSCMTIKVEYDRIAFTPAEISELQREFAELGPLRFNELYKERGGDWTTLSIVLTYIGLKIADGLFESAGAALRKKIIEIVRRVGFKPAEKDGAPTQSQTVSFVLSFDDTEVEIVLPLDTTEHYIDHLLSTAASHLLDGPLLRAKASKLIIPFTRSEQGWHQSCEWYCAQHLDRYWGVHVRHNPCIQDIYDSEERRFLRIEADQFTDDHDGRGMPREAQNPDASR